MENPQNLKSFLKRFERTPKDGDLLKNFRALLYDANESLQSALINSQKNHVPRVITNGSQKKMRHVLQKMTQVRSSKTKTY